MLLQVSAAVRRVAVVAIFVAGACSVPERDNPFDPTRRPEAVLLVVTPEGGRGTPFVFDASSSRDPRDRGPLRFEWEIHDERYDTLPNDDGFDDFEDDTGDTIQVSFPNPFPLAFVSTNGEGSIPRRVRVKVIAADGAYDIAEGTVVVRNQRPIVDPGEDLFVSPLRTEPVLLDALGGGAEPTTLDEDEDDLRFTWTQVSGPEVTLTYDDPNRRRLASFDPPGDGRSITFLVTGSDGMASATDTVGVHFESQVWATTAFAARVYRIFPGFHYRTELLDAAGAPTTFASLSSFTVTSSGHLWTTESGGAGTTLVRRLSPDLRRISQTVIPGYARVMYAEASGEDL